jgi:hypothetical protein
MSASISQKKGWAIIREGCDRVSTENAELDELHGTACAMHLDEQENDLEEVSRHCGKLSNGARSGVWYRFPNGLSLA